MNKKHSISMCLKENKKEDKKSEIYEKLKNRKAKNKDTKSYKDSYLA